MLATCDIYTHTEALATVKRRSTGPFKTKRSVCTCSFFQCWCGRHIAMYTKIFHPSLAHQKRWKKINIAAIFLLVLCCIPNVSFAIDSINYVIFVAHRKSISRVQMPMASRTPIDLKQVTFINSMDYDAKYGCYYWADYTRIVRQCGPDQINTLIASGVTKIQDIAFDWLSENLYFVDSKGIYVIDTTMDAIEKAKGKDHWRKTVVQFGSYAKNLTTSLVLQPERGHLYWVHNANDGSVKEHIGVYRANLDGTARERLAWPSGTAADNKPTVDFLTNCVYWIQNATHDGLHVNSCAMKGDGNVEYHYEDDFNIIRKPASQLIIRVYNNTAFWLDTANNIMTNDISNTTVKSLMVVSQPEPVKAFKVFIPGSQLGKNACSRYRHNCSHLCVGAPNNGFQCLCPDGVVQDKDGSCKCLKRSITTNDCYKHMMLYDWCDRRAPLLRCDDKTCLLPNYRCGNN